MTSPDGITWAERTAAANHNWSSITYGRGYFVAVASTNGIDNQVMISGCDPETPDPEIPDTDWSDYRPDFSDMVENAVAALPDTF